MLRFGEKVMLFILRPIYRTFFERPLWWFLTKVKIFFMADVTAQLEIIERRLREDHQQRWATIDERLRNLEANNTAQWDALEKLLLSLFRQSEWQPWETGRESSAPQYMVTTAAAGVSRAPGSNHIS
ncbi:MAG TPA: hypothetical protein VHZ55_24855 [Bryobacteraceae bacterium]|jgi:hypothetical protein|nr:hypothetical protein [Bryobacteraceae bacterium]